jgi:hypothetical protein
LLPSKECCYICEGTDTTRPDLADANLVIRQIARVHVPGHGLDIGTERRRELPHIQEGFAPKGEPNWFRKLNLNGRRRTHSPLPFIALFEACRNLGAKALPFNA